jgi:hypothetical protein
MDQVKRRLGTKNTVPFGSSAGNVRVGARSGGGAAGGVTGSRSQPPQGPPRSVAKSAMDATRIVTPVYAGLPPRWRPGVDLEHERLLEIVQGAAFAQDFVIGIDATTRAALRGRGVGLGIVL